MAYLILIIWLAVLSFFFFQFPGYRILTAIIIGLSYTCWGIIIHKRSKTLYLPIILEYLAISLLAITVLIFISLRA